jgi:23S rRNA pseudouridine1911/1915/1917 synthase
MPKRHSLMPWQGPQMTDIDGRDKHAHRTLVANPAGRMRLDAYLAGELAPQYSRSQILKAIKAGLVVMNDRTARAADSIQPGDRIEFKVPAPAAPAPSAAPAPEVAVLYEDADIIFVNKPPGMAVHPSPGHPDSTLVDAVMARFPDLAAVVELDGSWRAGIVHRLDKDTSGVIVVARNSLARAGLSAQFKARTVEKIYLALAVGHPAHDRITIDQPIGRHQSERKRMSVRSRAGREAFSEVRVIQRCHLPVAGGAPIAVSLLAVRPRTGRTHQIRVHLSSVGHPCLGDLLYGRQERGKLPLRRQALHAFYLAVTHPRTGARIGVVAPIAPDLEPLLTLCGADMEMIRSALPAGAKCLMSPPRGGTPK